MKPKEIYGLSRSRDKQGNVVKRSLNDYVNCLHTQVGSARDNMEVYVVEIYDGQETDATTLNEGATRLGGQMLDTYNQQIQEEVSCTIRTNINTANHHFVVMEEPKVLNPLKGQSDNGWHFEQQVYDAEGIARAVKAGGGSGNIPKVIEPISVALRGRNPNNPSERGKSNGNYKQRLEMNESGVANTITSVQKDNLVVEPQQNNTNTNGETEVFDVINKTNTREVLRILQEKVGKEKVQWAIGRFISILQEEVLRPRVYEEGVCEEGEQSPNILPGTSNFEKDSLFNRASRNEVRDMRNNDEYRCSSQGFELSKQFEREFNGIVSQLSYEDTQTKKCVLYLWRACQGASTLQQTLDSFQEVWESSTSTVEHIQSEVKYRIRKPTPRECFRLQGVNDKDIDTIQAAGISNSQQYKMAGNSIVVDVLYHIFNKMFIDHSSTIPFYQQTLF